MGHSHQCTAQRGQVLTVGPQLLGQYGLAFCTARERTKPKKKVNVVPRIIPERQTNSQLSSVKGIWNILHRIHHADSPTSSSQLETLWSQKSLLCVFTLLQGIFSASTFSNSSAALTEGLNHPDVIKYSLLSIPPKISPWSVRGNGLLHSVLGPQANHH